MKRLVLLSMLFLLGCPPSERVQGYVEPPPDGTVVTCPVSRKQCTKTPATPAAIYEMRTYYFCCDDCPARFAAAPERYATPP
jgi:YHS domain-containing protein